MPFQAVLRASAVLCLAFDVGLVVKLPDGPASLVGFLQAFSAASQRARGDCFAPLLRNDGDDLTFEIALNVRDVGDRRHLGLDFFKQPTHSSPLVVITHVAGLLRFRIGRPDTLG